MRYLQLTTFLFAALTLSATNVSAQLFSSELDSDAGWTIVADEDTSYEFGFDYTTLGIPPNPNNTSGSTTGLKMAANIVDPGGAALVSATPAGQSFSGSYTLEADFWLNFNTSGGTTEEIGGFVGYDAAGAPNNGIGLLGNSDGDSGATDYRIYSAGERVATRANEEEDIAAAFPGQAAPAAQTDSALFDPINNPATAANGTLGFGWHTLTLDVDAATSTVDMSIDGFQFGTVDASADPSVLSGGIALSFSDPFGSVASRPEFAFGVFDNVSVTQVPEPNGLWLAGFGALLVGTLRRRR